MKFFESIRIALFIFGSALLTLVVARNTATWYAKRFWGASGDFWQAVFDCLHNFFGGTDFNAGYIGSFIIVNTLYWTLSCVYMYFDQFGHPEFLRKYKIQPGRNEPTDRAALLKAVKNVFFNQTVVYGMFWFAIFYLMKFRGNPFSGPISSFQRIIFELLIFIIIEEIMFYYSHRALHSKLLYKRIHKKHHEWTAPIAVISVYCHPIEHVVSNLLPCAVGPLICGSHLATLWLWQIMIVANTLNSHCGYHFPFMPSPEAHDYHHLKFTNNFGVLGVLDRLHGTDDHFRKTPAYSRHLMMLTLTPPRVIYPENDQPSNEKSGRLLASQSQTVDSKGDAAFDSG